MKIAFIHYHLKTGGVTTVLTQQVEALKDTCDILVLTGEPTDAILPADTVYIEGLGYYDGLSQKEISPQYVATAAAKAIYSKWEAGCDVLHVHNPNLAKNKNFLIILKTLQKRGIRLFLQIHDFAEDGRPLSYFSDEYVSDCHYGVINSRDYNVLLTSGLKKKGLHKIFNTVKPLNSNIGATDDDACVLYPIRAIRRKNIGEAILLSLFFKNDQRLCITLPPNSPTDIKSYNGWKTFAKEKNLNVAFDVGLHHDFNTLVKAASFLITTSITEGFGFSFLEPWTANKFLWGRKLPDICHDFEIKGIRLDHLYSRLNVPVEWISEEQLFKKWRASILKSSAMFNRITDERTISESFAKATRNRMIDFGLLDEAFQKMIISHLLSARTKRDRLIDLNPFLSHPGEVPTRKTLIRNNRQQVTNSYTTARYKQTLMDIYASVSQHDVQHRIDKKILLSQFFNPETFSLLKWSDYVE